MGRVGFRVGSQAQEQWGQALTDEIYRHYDLVPQGVGAELIADRWSITREEMDEFSASSHHRAHQATEEGRFDREILPITVGDHSYVTDQGIRPGTTVDGLRELKPAFREDGRVTAGNSSQVSAGAAALLLMSREKAKSLGLAPRATVVDQAVLGVDPVTMLTGPIPATKEILERSRLSIADLDLIEVNEAFASVVLAWQREHKADMDRVNRRGGAIAVGHPLGSTGARLITSLIHALEDDDLEFGLVTMCCGGGIGTATLLRRTG